MPVVDFIRVQGMASYPSNAPQYFEAFEGRGYEKHLTNIETAINAISPGGATDTQIENIATALALNNVYVDPQILTEVLNEVTITLPNSTPISTDIELADALWNGQNAKLEAENAYCDQLQKELDKKQSRLGEIGSKLLDIFQEVIGEVIATAVQDAVSAAYGALAGWVAGIVTELTLEWGLDALALLLTRGNELLEGIKTENKSLLKLEKSRENYEYREQVLARHREDIKMVLEQIRQAEKDIDVRMPFEIRELLKSLEPLENLEDLGDLNNLSKLNDLSKLDELANLSKLDELTDMNVNLKDLALVDATIESGDLRFRVKGKAWEF